MKAITHLLLTWFLLISGSLFILASPWIILRQHHLFELLAENPYLAIQLDHKSLLAEMLVLMLFGVAAIFIGTHLRHGGDPLPAAKGVLASSPRPRPVAPKRSAETRPKGIRTVVRVSRLGHRSRAQPIR